MKYKNKVVCKMCYKRPKVRACLEIYYADGNARRRCIEYLQGIAVHHSKANGRSYHGKSL